MKEQRTGQSLVEILLAVAIGTILITAAVTAIVPSLTLNKQAVKVQIASALAKQLVDNVRVWSEGNWNNVLALATGTSYRYYLNTTSSPFLSATGTESIVVASGTAATSSLTTGLVGYWPLDEGVGTTTYDASGNGRNGTFGSTAPTWVTGKIGTYALSFNGTTTSVLDNTGGFLPTGSSTRTISFWAYPLSSGNYPAAFAYGCATEGYGCSDAGQGKYVSVEVSTGWGFKLDAETCGSAVTSIPAPQQAWHLFTLVFNGDNTLTFYIDGVGGSPVTPPCTINTAVGGGFSMGTGMWGYFNGSLDDVRVYDRALSAAEITQLYNLGQSTVTYNRYFYLSDVSRDTAGNIVSSGGTYDPSTKQLTVVYSWQGGPVNTMSTYIIRGRNNVFSQTDWSGGPGLSGPITSTNSQFASSSNIDYQTSSGAIYVSIPGY